MLVAQKLFWSQESRSPVRFSPSVARPISKTVQKRNSRGGR